MKKKLKLKYVLPTLYVIFLVLGFFYVKSVLSEDVIEVKEEEQTKEKAVEVKPVNVELLVRSPSQNVLYDERMQNTDTFDDFLEYLVDQDKFTFEKTEYTYGTVYDKINGEKAPEGYTWRVYIEDEEITYNTKGIKLDDNSTYKLILDKKPDTN